jgi:hypothetical protein
MESIRALANRNAIFQVRVIGDSRIRIPADLGTHITHLGRLDFKKMYAEIEQADFIIAALDPFCEEHRQYLVGCATGSLQLSFGFLKPMIISQLFMERYGLENAAVAYKDNELLPAMESAIGMSGLEYEKMQLALERTAKETYGRSLENLKTAMETDHKTGLPTNMAMMCKTYHGNLPALKILKESIDRYNMDKIPFYVVAPAADMEIIRGMIITGGEDYRIEILAEEPIRCAVSLGGWLDQQVAKLRFYRTNLCDYYLVIDSDSYFIRNFFVSDFMHDSRTPYIVCHEGKSGTLLNTKFGDTSAMHEKESFIKSFFGRAGKPYRFLTSPFMFSSEVCRALDQKYGADWCIKLCPCEAAWHGEMMLCLGVPYKPAEMFFEAMVYQGKCDFWRKLRITPRDISRHYLGIVMQDKLVKGRKY